MKAAGKRWVQVAVGLALTGASALAAAGPTFTTAGSPFGPKTFTVTPSVLGPEESRFAPFNTVGVQFAVISEIDQFSDGSGRTDTAAFSETGIARSGPSSGPSSAAQVFRLDGPASA